MVLKNYGRDVFLVPLVLLVIIASMVVYYHYLYSSYAVVDIIFWLAMTGISFAILNFTLVGQKAKTFYQETLDEVKKVVWPTRQEAMQTTLMVLILSVTISIILWIIDSFFLYVITFITGMQ